ncbi:MAG: glycosyltransferase family 4 protein [bacterium]|nr:glycosyltransferase family 4 protein [bacterium]
MRILVLSHYYPPEGNAPASRVHAMCRRWVGAGHAVTVATCVPNVPGGVPYSGYRNRWRQEEQLDGVHVVRVWTFLAANRGTRRRTLNYLSYFASATWRSLRVARPDVVVATTPQFFCGWAGVWGARLRRRPLVLDVRDLWPESIAAVGALSTAAAGKRSFSMRVLEWLEKRMYRAARHIVTVGPGYAGELGARDVPRAKLSVIPNGVELDLFTPRPADPELRERAGARPGDFLVGYVGTVGLAHGLEVVLDAARRARAAGLARLRFVVVGDGARLDALREATRADDPGNVRWIGRQPKEAMPAWLASLDAALVHLTAKPLFETVLPSKIFEAAAMARPILLGARGQAAGLVRESGCGVCFEPEDAEGLLAAIGELTASTDAGGGLGEAGRAFVLRNCDLDRLAREYEGLLADVVGARAPGLADPRDPV